ncbi:DUF535 family protein [Ideonella sp. 4Y11]|uniref:DUF535 family protein n=2 Tax=Ideonella aquatica TaxID=2824119 RepID=A0A940YL45_9BURK|nr:DUF535 family protein [Ideonella aquatica]
MDLLPYPPMSSPTRLTLNELRRLPAMCRGAYPPRHPRALAHHWLWAKTVLSLDAHLDMQRQLRALGLGRLLREQPQTLRKLHDTYPFQGLGPEARRRWLLGHLQAARTLFGPQLSRRLARGEPLLACRINLPDGQGQMRALLGAARQQHLREGDLTLALYDPFGTKLYALTFSLQPCEHGVEVVIGALQGQMPLPLTRHITKLTEGLRPPALLLYLLQCLAEAVGARRLRACGRERHIHHGSERSELVRFDYDAFWRDYGGQPDGQGFYELPVAAPRREVAEIPSHKRAQYRRRYQFMDEMRQELHGCLAEHGAPLDRAA